MGIRALFMIFAQAPGALVRGRFEPDDEHVITGLPARLVALVLLAIGLSPLVDVAVFATAGPNGPPFEYLFARVASFFAAVILVAFLTVAFRKRKDARRTRPARDEDDEDDDFDDEYERRRNKPWRGPMR
jgi:hypothetical protein